MTDIQTDWWSPEGEKNAQWLRVHRAHVFSALAEVDALGHRILRRIVTQGKTVRYDSLVAAMLLRRAVTQFTGLRHLLWNSAVDPSKLVARALFETLLSTRYLVHGGRRSFDLNTPSNDRSREVRARYFMAGSLRNEIYQRQAVIDRVWNRKRIPADQLRGIQDEISSRLSVLNINFPVQQKNFGAFAFQRAKRKQYHDEMKWYSFGFRGNKPKSVQRLADKFGLIGYYWMLYKPFSEMNHPATLSQDVQLEGSRADILHPYITEDFDAVVLWASSWQSLILIYLSKAFHPTSISDAQQVHLRVTSLLRDLRPSLITGIQ